MPGSLARAMCSMTAASGIVHEELHEKEFARKGGTLHAIQLWVNLPKASKMSGAKDGILFAFDRIRRTPNTFDAHRLVWYAEQQKKQDDVVERLFHGYFIEGVDIGDREVLASVAERSGLDGVDTRRFLQSHEGEVEVRDE